MVHYSPPDPPRNPKLPTKRETDGNIGVSDAGVVATGEAIRGYLQHLAVERGLAANTVESYRRDLSRYESALAGRGKDRLADVKPSDLAEFLASLREGDAEHEPLAVSSAARAVIAVRGLRIYHRGRAQMHPGRVQPR